MKTDLQDETITLEQALGLVAGPFYEESKRLEAEGWKRWTPDLPPAGFDVECTILGESSIYLTTVDENPASWNVPGLFWKLIIQ